MFLAAIGCIALGYLGIKFALRMAKANKRNKIRVELQDKLDNLQLPGKDFDKFYMNLSSDNERIEVINKVQKNIELDRAKVFAKEVMKLAGEHKNTLKQIVSYIKEVQQQDIPLGVAGIIFRRKEQKDVSSFSEYLMQKFEITPVADCIVKDPRIKLHQLSIFTQRFYEGILIIANNGQPLTYELRKDLAKKLQINLLYSSIDIFSDEATYNKEILDGRYPLMSKEEILATTKQEDLFRFGGGEFMKDELVKLYQKNKDYFFVDSDENKIDKHIERIKGQ